MDSRLEADVIEGFEFVDNGRTFTCQVDARGTARAEVWWWFRVSTADRASVGDRHRYAPFRAAAGDTRASVQSAVVAFYDDLLARRALPAPSHWRRGAPRPATAPK
jgi:hypothetical protein